MKRIAVLTSGGDAPGMNAAIRSVVRTGLYHGLEVLGVRHGYKGLMEGDFIPLDSRSVAGIIHRGGTILYTARSERFKTVEGIDAALDQLRSGSVDGLVVIGGDGSYRGALKLAEKGFPVIGIPGTIDNDIAGTDETIGYDSALNTALDSIRKLRDTASSHDRLFIVEVMGRESGFLALEVALASGAECVVLPETQFDECMICDQIHRAWDRKKDHFFIILAEGVMGAHELKARLEDTAGYTARFTVLGYLLRGGSPTCYDTNLATRMGSYSVEMLLGGHEGVMIGCVDHKMMINPLALAWEQKKQLNFDLLELMRIMNV